MTSRGQAAEDCTASRRQGEPEQGARLCNKMTKSGRGTEVITSEEVQRNGHPIEGNLVGHSYLIGFGRGCSLIWERKGFERRGSGAERGREPGVKGALVDRGRRWEKN